MWYFSMFGLSSPSGLKKCAYNLSNKLFYQPELLFCKYLYSKQYCTQVQIFTECKASKLQRCSSNLDKLQKNTTGMKCTTSKTGEYWLLICNFFTKSAFYVAQIKLSGRRVLVHHAEFAWGLSAAWSQKCTVQTGESNSHLNVQAIGYNWDIVLMDSRPCHNKSNKYCPFELFQLFVLQLFLLKHTLWFGWLA